MPKSIKQIKCSSTKHNFEFSNCTAAENVFQIILKTTKRSTLKVAPVKISSDVITTHIYSLYGQTYAQKYGQTYAQKYGQTYGQKYGQKYGQT